MTNWIPGSQPPVRSGIYQRRRVDKGKRESSPVMYAYFNTGDSVWSGAGQSIDTLRNTPALLRTPSPLQCDDRTEWRGVSAEESRDRINGDARKAGWKV